MSKPSNPISLFKDVGLNLNDQKMIRGGSIENDIAKKLLKLEASIAKGDQKGISKHTDELDCLGYTVSLSCCGNGLGTW